MTPTERKNEAAIVLQIVAEEVSELVRDAVEREHYGTMHVQVALQGGRLNTIKTCFEKIRQGKQR